MRVTKSTKISGCNFDPNVVDLNVLTANKELLRAQAKKLLGIVNELVDHITFDSDTIVNSIISGCAVMYTDINNYIAELDNKQDINLVQPEEPEESEATEEAEAPKESEDIE